MMAGKKASTLGRVAAPKAPRKGIATGARPLPSAAMAKIGNAAKYGPRAAARPTVPAKPRPVGRKLTKARSRWSE